MNLAQALVVNKLVESIHQQNVDAGWYTDLKYAKKISQLKQNGFTDLQIENIISICEMSEIKGDVPSKIALCHSELSEALEGDRKGLMDDKLPHRKMVEVELADTVIRIFDLAGFMKLDIGGAMLEKIEYNGSRADHKITNRLSDGGKKY